MGIFSPNRAIDFLPGNKLPRLIGQQDQHQGGLRLEPYPGAIASQFAAIGMERKGAERSYCGVLEAGRPHILGKPKDTPISAPRPGGRRWGAKAPWSDDSNPRSGDYQRIPANIKRDRVST